MKPGERIRQIREDKKMELAEVAGRIGINSKELANIEEGKILPSIGVLARLGRVLGTRLGTFLDDNPVNGAVVTRDNDLKALLMASDPTVSRNDNLKYLSLAKDKCGRHMEPFLVEIAPGEASIPLTSNHEGEEFIHLLSGEVLIKHGNDTYRLTAGDSIYFDSIVDHQVVSANGQKALLLAVIYLPV